MEYWSSLVSSTRRGRGRSAAGVESRDSFIAFISSINRVNGRGHPKSSKQLRDGLKMV